MCRTCHVRTAGDRPQRPVTAPPEAPFPVSDGALLGADRTRDLRGGSARKIVGEKPDDDHGHCGEVEFPAGCTDPDGAETLFTLLADRSPDAYLRFAEDYYETSLNLAAVTAVLGHQPLTDTLVATLNPDLTLGDLAADLAETDYAANAQDDFN